MYEEFTEAYMELLRTVYSNRKYVHVGEVDVGLQHTVEILKKLGAAQPLLLAGNRGTSQTPMDDSLELHLLNVEGGNIVDSARNFQQALANPPSEVRDAIERWDPDRSAKWICTAALAEFGPICDRPKYGRRKPAWTELEDKTTIDAVWDSLGVARSKSSVIDVSDPDLIDHARVLDQGYGTIWAADNRDGVHGGGIGLRWMRSDQDFETTIEDMAGMAETVRIMPFLEGIPMSIHGIVFSDSVVVLRPVELIVLRPKAGNQLLWGGCSTGYDPSEQDRVEMRSIARRVGEGIGESIGYRGPFSIDGIVTADGFRPTELNPRLSGGFGPQLRGIPDFPFAPLCWAVMENEPLDYQPNTLENMLLRVADENRVLRGHVISSRRVDELSAYKLIRDGGEFRECIDDEVPNAVLTCGPSPVGSIMFLDVVSRTYTPSGIVAPVMIEALRLADELLGTDFGPVTCAQEKRRRRKFKNTFSV